MHLLVLAPEAVDADAVSSALDGADLSDANVLVVSPALNDSPLAFWMSDSDEAIAEATEAEEETVASLEAEGVEAAGNTGESEPVLALQDALATFPADRVLIFVHPDQEQQYKEDDICGEVERRFELPVTQAKLPG